MVAQRWGRWTTMALNSTFALYWSSRDAHFKQVTNKEEDSRAARTAFYLDVERAMRDKGIDQRNWRDRRPCLSSLIYIQTV